MRSALIALVLASLALPVHADDGRDHHDDARRDDARHVPRVFDAQGKVVGALETNSNQDGVFLTINGALTFVAITRAGMNNQPSASQFQWASTGIVAYPSSDCSGSPVILYGYGPRPSMAVRQGADVTVYVASDANGGPVQVASAHQNPVFDQCTPFTSSVTAFAVGSTYVVTQHYPEPLTIR